MSILNAFGYHEDTDIGKKIRESCLSEDVPMETIQFLVGLFCRARMSGFTPTLVDLREMNPIEREAARLAGERHMATEALIHARAMGSPLDRAAVAAVLDGGSTLRQAMLEGQEAELEEVRARTRATLAHELRAPYTPPATSLSGVPGPTPHIRR